GTGRLEPAVEKDGADHGFDRIGEHRRTPRPSAPDLALPQAQLLPERQVLRDAGEGLLVDEVRAQAREVALRQAREARIELQRDDAVQNAVAEELEPLVVRGAVATMGQRPAQQLGIVETVADSPGEALDVHPEPVCRPPPTAATRGRNPCRPADWRRRERTSCTRR